MGLRTASVRHPHAMVMAPALTKPTQPQNFKLPPSSPSTHVQPASVSSIDEHTAYISGDDACRKPSVCEVKELDDVFDNLNTLAVASELLKINDCGSNSSGHRTIEDTLDLSKISDIMNNSPPHMGEHKDKMGLQKCGLDTVSSILRDKRAASDVDQLFNNFAGVLPGTDIAGAGDMGQNVDDLMQVITSMEVGSGDRICHTSNDLSAEADSIFPLSGTDLTSNLSSFEKELLNDVDMMSISMEEQLLDGANALKENETKELLAEIQKRHVKIDRQIDFLKRRLRKSQSRTMGQHVSNEIAGVFEHVHRTLKRSKDIPLSALQPLSDGSKLLEPSTSLATSVIEPVSQEKLKPISQSSAKNLVRKLEMTAILQANATARRRNTKYFGSGSTEPSAFRSSVVGTVTLPPWASEHKQDLRRVAGLLSAETRLVEKDLDSDATESSSGGESCDEMQVYNNPHQQYLNIQKRAAYKYAVDRAAVASKWMWLQAQISDLEYRIRQYTDLHRQIRASKGAITLGGPNPTCSVPSSPTAINGYRGQLPGASPLSTKALDSTANGAVPSPDVQCSRTRPLTNFRKRKLLQIMGLHAISKKAAQPSSIRCGCVQSTGPCALCTGRTDPTHPRDISDYLSKSERISLLDPTFHPVFSLPEDTSASIHFEAIMRTPEWQQRSARPNVKTMKYVTKVERTDKLLAVDQPKKIEHRRKYSRLIKTSTVNALTNKIKSKFRGRKPGVHYGTRFKRKRHTAKMAIAQLQALTSDNSHDDFDQFATASGTIKSESPSSSPLLSMQSTSGYKRSSRGSSYDIDNIVIPYSVAAATRVEKLQYKEILTPKWRLVDPEFATRYITKNNGLVRDSGEDSDEEDVTDDAVLTRHEKSEVEERKKFLSYMKFPLGYGRSRSHRRTDSRAESSGANTPDPMSPQHVSDHIENTLSPVTSPPATPLPLNMDEIPSISVLRRRTMSQSRGKDKELPKDDTRSNTPTQEAVEIPPFDTRSFPLNEEVYDKMVKNMPEHHHFQTNIRAQDTREYTSPISYLDEKMGSPGSESTESAFGDEDPNDPEWIDMEHFKERSKR